MNPFLHRRRTMFFAVIHDEYASFANLLRPRRTCRILGVMNASKLIRALLTKFPALRPKEIERLLGEYGVLVDTNLIGVARLRHRRAKRDEQLLLRLLGRLFDQRPDLWPLVQASFDDVTRQVVQVATARPGLSDDEIVEQLATRLSEQSAQGASSGRVSQIFLRVLERHPQHRRSYEMAMGAEPGGIESAVLHVNGLEHLTDKEIEKFVLAWLEENYPAGPTAEAVARAYLERLRQRATEAKEDANQPPETGDEDGIVFDPNEQRVDAALAMLLSESGARSGADLDQLRGYVEQIIAEHPDWTDGQITDHVIGLRNDQEAGSAGDQRGRLSIKDLEGRDGLRIRKRP